MEYRERLTAPVWYWLVGVTFGATTAGAIGLWLGPWVAVTAGMVTVVALALALGWMSRIEIRVDDHGLRVGESLLEWPYAGTVEALDAPATRARLGVDADACAHVVQRAWLNQAVLVQVADAADPHPYWLVSTRQPAQLVAAIERARPGGTP